MGMGMYDLTSRYHTTCNNSNNNHKKTKTKPKTAS